MQIRCQLTIDPEQYAYFKRGYLEVLPSRLVRLRDGPEHEGGERSSERGLQVMTGRNLGAPIYEYLRRICRESMTREGVTTLLPLNVARLPA